MSTSTVAIDSETAHHVLWHFDRGGYQPGTFTEHLMVAVSAADPANQARLALGFPELVAAVQIAQNEPDGIAQLHQIAQAGR